jgi:transposase-like protein
VQKGIKSGNVSETCRRHGIAPNLFYRWKDEAEQGAKAALERTSAAAATKPSVYENLSVKLMG